MIDVFSTTGTIFALILLGYLAVRHGAFSAEDLRVLGKFVISFALPALIFRAVSTRDLGEILNIGYLGGFLIGSLAVMVGGWFWSRRIMGQSSLASTFQAMGMACANSGFVGYPILLMALPGVAATSLAMNMVVENLVLIPLILILAEQAGGTAGKRQVALQIAGRLATSPIILALIAGLAVSVAGIRLPDVVTGPVNLLAAASASVSLMVIGGTLVGLPVRTLDVSVVAVVLGKLIALPLAVWLGLRAMAAIGYPVGDPQLEQAAVLMAATPAMSIYPILAQRYGQENGAAMAMLVMTVLSFFTISLLLFLLAGLG